MKKTLLTLLCLAGISSMAIAADVTEDFSAWTQSVASDANPQTVTSESTGLKWSFAGDSYTSNAKYPPIYVMLKSGNNAGEISTTINFEVTEIQIVTSGACSTNAGNTISISVGETSLATKFALNKTNSTFKLPIAAANRVASGTYTFKADGSKNSQISKITFVGATTNPKISLITEKLDFAAPLNMLVTKNIELSIENISDDINFATTGDVFAGNGIIGASDVAEGFAVTMKSAAAGTFTGETTVSAEGVTAKVPLTAIVVDKEGTEADPLSVSNVLALNSLYGGEVYVTGIICDKTAANAKDGVIQEAAEITDTNILLKDSEGNMIPVQLSGDARTTLNIKDNSGNIGKTVIIKGLLQSYFGAPGVKNTVYVSGLDGSSIDNVSSDVEAANAVYYNLQGVRVENPVNGVFIRVINDKAEKIVL